MNFDMQLKDGEIQGHWKYKDLDDDDIFGIGAVLGEEVYRIWAFEDFDTKKTKVEIYSYGAVLEISLDSGGDISIRRKYADEY